MKHISDKDNICLKCDLCHPYAKGHHTGDPEEITFCICTDTNLPGANKGYRRKCKAFIPKEAKA